MYVTEHGGAQNLDNLPGPELFLLSISYVTLGVINYFISSPYQTNIIW